MRKDL